MSKHPNSGDIPYTREIVSALAWGEATTEGRGLDESDERSAVGVMKRLDPRRRLVCVEGSPRHQRGAKDRN